MENTSKIKCPNCQHEIDVQNVLAHQVEKKIRIEYQSKLDSAKRNYEQQSHWKQIENVIANTIDMYGSVKGIAGNAVQSLPALELPEIPELN